MEIKDRIELVLHFKNLSPSQFAETIAVQRSSVSHILSGRNKPSLDFITKVVQAFPEVSFDWLIAGNGGLNDQSETTVNNNGSADANSDTPVNNQQEAVKNTEEATVKPIKQQVQEQTNQGYQASINRTLTQVILCYDDHTFETFSPPTPN